MKNYTLIFSFIFSLSFLNGQVKEVSLVSKMNGQKTLIDGQDIVFWGYGIDDPSSQNNKIFLPGPVLRFDVGDTVIIHLRNDSPEDHTIHWHGLDVDQANDGVPHTSSPVNGGGAEFTYTFVCKEPGSFIYHCHVLTTLHLSMGMYGLFIIDSEVENQIYNDSGKYTKEYNYLFSELNTSWNANPLSPGPFYLYEADYGMVNGWAGPEIKVKNQSITGDLEDSIGMRLANTGYGRVETIFPNDFEVKVYGSDGREVNSFVTDTIQMFPGERFGVVGYPQSTINDSITVNYYDLNNDELYFTNYIPVNISPTSSTISQNLETLIVYPNPFDTDITIDNIGKKDTATITDLNGKQVWKGALTKGQNKINLNVEKGIYVLSFGGLQVKVVKQ
jgi:plastocyanin